jgi:N-acetyltransferase
MLIDAPVLIGQTVRLEPLQLAHKEPLRAACAQDQDVWEYYIVCLIGAHYDTWWASIENWANGDMRVPFAVLSADNQVIGLSSFYRWDETPADTIYIGSTYYAPAWRSTTVNPETKLLMMDHAFAQGKQEIVFHVDVRNQRSQAAMRKLGAIHTHTVSKHMTTWTGHVRDTAFFSITRDAWPDVRSRLEKRL